MSTYLRARFGHMLRDEEGQTLTEYALILVLVALAVAAAAAPGLATAIGGVLDRCTAALTGA